MSTNSTLVNGYITGSGTNMNFDENVRSVAGTDGKFDRDELETLFKRKGYSSAEAKLLAALFMTFDRTNPGGGLDAGEFNDAFANIAALSGTGDLNLSLGDIKAALLARSQSLLNVDLSRGDIVDILVSLGLATSSQAERLYAIFGETTLAVVFAESSSTTADADIKDRIANLVKSVDIMLKDGSVYSNIISGVRDLQAAMKAYQQSAKGAQDDLTKIMEVNAQLNNLANILTMYMQQFNTYKDASTSVSKQQP